MEKLDECRLELKISGTISLMIRVGLLVGA